MKKLIYIILALMFSVSVSVNCNAQSSMKVKDLLGKTVKLEPLKTGRYEIAYLVDGSGNLVTAPGVLFATVDDQTLKVGIVMKLIYNGGEMVYVSSMGPIRGWIASGDKYVTYDTKNIGDSSAVLGYGAVAAYSKKYNQLMISGTDGNGTKSSIVVLYNPKPTNKISEQSIIEKIFEIGGKKECIDIYPPQ